MSRYRATTGELLEQVRKEAKTKDIYHMAFAGDNVEAISKKLKLDVSTVKKILGERFSMSDFKANEKQNHHSENAFELAKQFGTGKEIHDMKAIIKFVNQRGYINKEMFDIGARITKKYASKLEAYREVQEEILNEYNPNFGKDTSAGRTKETHADNKKTQGEDRVKSLENEIQRLKLELENEKNATVKPEPNPDTGEVPLTIGIAHKYIKDKADKKEDKKEVKKEEVEIDENFSPAMITQLRKAYGPLKGKRIAPEPLMKIFDKIDKDKNALIQLFKADIPFVSQLAVSRLISKHNMKGAEINKLREEVEDNIQEARLPSFKDLVKYKYGDDHAGAIHFSKIDGKEYHWNYLDRKGGQYSISTKKTGEIRVSRAGADSKINKVVKEEIEDNIQESETIFDLDEKAKEFHMFSTKKDAEKKAKEIGGKVVTGTGKSKGYFAAMKEELDKEEVELTEYFATVHSDKKPIVDFVKKYARTPSTQASIDYVDDDAGGNIEFEGKGAHDLADKVKAKFGVRVTKESFEPIENKSLEEMSLSSAERARGSDRPITIQYTYMRNPILFMQTLKGTKTGKKLKHVFPRKMGSDEYILKGTYQDHIDFLKTLNSKGIMPNNKIIGEELEEDTNKYITEKIKGLENKAKKTGMPYGILKKVYDRGMAAWKGGHRPGAGQQQWAFARVNSFVTKSSGTWGKADKDLAQKVRAAESVEESTKVEGGPPTDGGPGSGAHNHDNKPSSRFDKVSNVKSFGKNLKGVTNVRQDGNRLEFDSNDGTATAREILKKFGKGKVKVTSILDDDDPEMKATVVVTPVKESRQLKDNEKEMMVVKDGKVIVIDKSDFDKYKSKGYIQAEDKEEENEACWDSHKQVGTKMKGGKRVPNCVPKNEEVDEGYTPLGSGKLTPAQKRFQDVLKRATKDKESNKAAYLKTKHNLFRLKKNEELEEVQEADLTDKQVDMVKKVADKLPKDDFKKRYGKDADNVKFGTATNIVKKKLNIDGYDGARNLVDRLLKKEKGDE